MDGSSNYEDEAWRPKSNVRSFLTVLAYLPTDEPCVGGEKVIDGEVVSAEPGRVVVFPHDLLHGGRPVESGQKLVLRNDIIGVGVAGDTMEHGLATFEALDEHVETHLPASLSLPSSEMC